MSYLSPTSDNKQVSESIKKKGSVKRAFSKWIIDNYGSDYKKELNNQKTARRSSRAPSLPLEKTTIGIIGGGFAGMYAGLILQSLGIEFEIFESSDRVGGRIDTWYSTKYDINDKDRSALYGEVGGMRVPQFSADMLPVQHLGLALNSVLQRNGLDDDKVYWRKFYYSSDVQRLRYNNMNNPILAKNVSTNSLNFGKNKGGDIDDVWIKEVKKKGQEPYLPINMILDKVNAPFIQKINHSFADGFEELMKYDNYSMWAYLTNVFKLKDLDEYYDPKMGDKEDNLPYNVASYLETLNVGTGMYSVSFVEMVIAVYDWGGSKNPYDKSDENIYMVTVDNGMQNFPNACKTVLNLEQGVLPDDGYRAQIEIGMLKGKNKKYGYSPSNLTKDAEPPESVPKAFPPKPAKGSPSKPKQRVFMEHKVTSVSYEPRLYNGHGGVVLKVEEKDRKRGVIVEHNKLYPYAITTLPNGAYLNGQLKENFFDNLSFSKARAIRECNYMPSFKAFITFKSQFWAELGDRFDKGLGVAASDHPNRQIVYPSYGYDSQYGVLQIYCWAQDAERMGALSDIERVNECLKGIQYLYPEVDVNEEFAGYEPEVFTKTWFWDRHAGGGAFALFKPGQFKSLYPTLLTPEFNGHLNFAGECCSVHHGWIVGALDSAYNSVLNILEQMGRQDKIDIMKKTWGSLEAPDID